MISLQILEQAIKDAKSRWETDNLEFYGWDSGSIIIMHNNQDVGRIDEKGLTAFL